MKQGHGHHRHGVTVDPEDLDRPSEDGGQVPARDHGALREPGGARCVELGDDVVRTRLESGIARLPGVAPRGVLGKGDVAPDGGHRRPDLGHRCVVVGAVGEHGGTGVLEDGRDLHRREAPIDGHADGTEQGAAEEHLEELDAIAVQEGHPVTRSDPVGSQGVRHPHGAFVQLPPGLRFRPQGQHGCFGLLGRPVAKHRRGRSRVVLARRVGSRHGPSIPPSDRRVARGVPAARTDAGPDPTVVG